MLYRIHVVSITVPPLRERHDDVLLLAQFFLNRIAQRTNKPVSRLSLPAARMLLAHDWPGNVRELENCMERAVALCRFDEVTVDDLPATLQPVPATIMMPTNPEELVTLEEMGRRYARKVVQATAGNKALAARVLGIHRRSLYRRLEPRHPAPIEDQK
jgi:DNA-binding NtrC family response regulator